MNSGDYLVESSDDILITFDGKLRVDSCKIADLCYILRKSIFAVLAELLLRETECISLGWLSSKSAKTAAVLADVG